MIRRLALTTVAASIGVLALSTSASAHIDPDPSEAQAGDTVTVGFTVQHGCDGSPTTEVVMRLAEGVTDAMPEEVEGWDGSVDDDVITFTGGLLAADTEGTFEITMTLPPTPDTTIYFPFVQHCEVGEIRWIGIPDEPGDELDEPAPAMDLVGPVVTTTVAPTTPATTEPATPDTTEAPVATTVAPVESTDPAPVTTDTAPSPEASASENTDSDGNSTTGTIMFIVSVLAVALVGGIAVFAARRNKAGDDAPTDGAAE